MNLEPEVGEIVSYNYDRYKCVETSDFQMGLCCETYCAMGQINAPALCGFIECSGNKRKDGKFVHFVKRAPRKRRHVL